MKKIAFALFTLTLALAGCEKTVDEHIDEAIDEYILNGYYESSNGMEIQIEDDNVIVAGFTKENHRLNSDPSVFTVGDTYIKNIKKTATDEWEGEILKINHNMLTQELTIKGYEKTTITPNLLRDGIEISNSNYYESLFTKIDKPAGGGGNGGNNGGSGVDTVHKERYSGKELENITISYTPPAGVKSMTIAATSFDFHNQNYADMFVRKGSEPVIYRSGPYRWDADFAGVNPNVEDEVYTVPNPSGTYYITLHGYNLDFSTWLVITITK